MPVAKAWSLGSPSKCGSGNGPKREAFCASRYSFPNSSITENRTFQINDVGLVWFGGVDSLDILFDTTSIGGLNTPEDFLTLSLEGMHNIKRSSQIL